MDRAYPLTPEVDLAKPLILHVGVHKTATTYLQDLLAHNREGIARAGRIYVPLDEIRPIIDRGITEEYRIRGSRLRRLGRLLAGRGNAEFDRLQSMAGPGSSLIISEENLLGASDECHSGAFYPYAEERIGLLVDSFADRPLQIWLALRSYPQFLASIYAEALRHGSAMPLTDFMANNANPEGQWTGLVDRLRRCFPDAEMHLWRYRDFARLEPRIVEGIAGLTAAEIRPLEESIVRPSPSAEAVSRAQELDPDMDGSARARAMAVLEKELPLSQGTRFAPWPQSATQEMQAAFDRECTALMQRGDLMFLQ